MQFNNQPKKIKNMTTLHLKKSISGSPLRLALLLIPLVFACLALSPMAQAVSPAPDGGYPNFNTAEGTDALFSLTIGSRNTGLGFQALYSNKTSSYNTATGFQALFSNQDGNNNTATGAAALLMNTLGSDNTATGFRALKENQNGNENTATGRAALQSNIDGAFNTAVGSFALFSNDGSNNTAIGLDALRHSKGNANTALGASAGENHNTGTNNIYIGNAGRPVESGTIRIGSDGPTDKTFIAAIRGVTTEVADAINVVIDSKGQLGTMSSSRRFKKEIKPMEKTSEAILGLKPVTFHYKSDTKDTPQFGLIAEEVAAVNPDLVVRDKEGHIYTVRYDAVNAMLLNEFLKARRQIDAQQKQIDALTAGLQKVSAQVEASKPAPQVVNNP
jgi:Chaperone of endosialidase